MKQSKHEDENNIIFITQQFYQTNINIIKDDKNMFWEHVKYIVLDIIFMAIGIILIHDLPAMFLFHVSADHTWLAAVCTFIRYHHLKYLLLMIIIFVIVKG